MNEDELVNRIYEQITQYLKDPFDPLVYDWETKNEARVKRLVRSFLKQVWNIEQSDNTPLPPPDWQFVHIGEGIFVETPNPELECQVR